MKILAIDTSCDETAAAVTDKQKVLSNIIWSQASLHAKWGGVVPSLAQRQHSQRIDWVIQKALSQADTELSEIDSVAVTVGPGLAIALGVGIDKAKEISIKYRKPLLPVNHIEAHLLSPFAISNGAKTNTNNFQISTPAFGLVVSGGNTLLIQVNKIGKYEILAQTSDDALGEALDKAARMLGLGYPGGAVLEKMAEDGKSDSYELPIPMIGQEKKMIFSYSGLKTAFWRLVEKETKEGMDANKVVNLAATFQETAFEHIIRVLDYVFKNNNYNQKSLLVGGGVAANKKLRKKIRKIGSKYKLDVYFPYSKKLYTDNAAMIGVCAYLNKINSPSSVSAEDIDRIPNLKIGQVIQKYK